MNKRSVSKKLSQSPKVYTVFLKMSGYWIRVVLYTIVLRKNILFCSKRKRQVLSLGNGSTCDVMGVGTVKIKMFDGVTHGVVYVSKMQKNLISLGRLDSISCRYSVVGEAMKIT